MRKYRLAVPAQVVCGAQNDTGSKALAGLPAIEWIGIVSHQVDQIPFAVIELCNHRCGEIPQKRRRGPFLHANEDEFLFGLRH